MQQFKGRLDKFGRSQDIVCSFVAQLQGTGCCSEFWYEESLQEIQPWYDL